MKLWLDDYRKPPFGYDLWAKHYEECVALLKQFKDHITEVSLDHDLAPEHYTDGHKEPNESVNKTGFRVLEWMKEHDWWPPKLVIHTLSDFGRARMRDFCVAHAPRDRCHITLIRAKM